MTCKVPKLLDLVRYRLALSAWALKFYDMWLTLSRAKSTGKLRMSRMEIACPSWPRATGVEPQLGFPLSITARGALQKLLSYTHTAEHGFMGLAGGSVTSSRALNQQLAFTAPYSSMKYILSWHVIHCNTKEMQTRNSKILYQKWFGSLCYSTLILQVTHIRPVKLLF